MEMKRKRVISKKVKTAGKNERKFSLKKEYKESWDFLKESKEHIYFVIILFFIFTAIAFFFGDIVNNLSKSAFGIDITQKIMDYIKELLLMTQGMSQKEITGFIFWNNIQSSFYGLVLGIFFGIFPSFAAVINGYVLGFVGALSVQSEGILILWRILPHGIFELPAVFIALGLGVRLGTYTFYRGKKSFKKWIINCLRVFLLIVIPLLIIAALIEGALISFGS